MSSSTKPSPKSYLLPKDFLSQPSPKVIVQNIDFTKTDLPQYDGLYATLIDNAFTAEECSALVQAAEARTDGVWEQAMINVGMGQQKLITDHRNSGRIIWDDIAMVEKIWSRIKDHVPEIQYLKNAPAITGNGPAKRNETWKLTRLNERMRFLKYQKGQYFRPHMDGSYLTPDGQELSFLTLHLYLNDSLTTTNDPLSGGATTFHSFSMKNRFDVMKPQFDVVPKTGRVLLFQHRGLLHSGADVTGGVKLTLRTDVMFRKVVEGEE